MSNLQDFLQRDIVTSGEFVSAVEAQLQAGGSLNLAIFEEAGTLVSLTHREIRTLLNHPRMQVHPHIQDSLRQRLAGLGPEIGAS